ncbi:MAG: hypothetical protein VKK63_08490 [Synechococcus sp.]|nr:hypothetical protein [Synechococcus sp.]
MKLATFRSKVAAGYSADWLIDDLTNNDLSLFDCINLANCAAERAKQFAGIDSRQFGDNYEAAKLWANAAADYCFV